MTNPSWITVESLGVNRLALPEPTVSLRVTWRISEDNAFVRAAAGDPQDAAALSPEDELRAYTSSGSFLFGLPLHMLAATPSSLSVGVQTTLDLPPIPASTFGRNGVLFALFDTKLHRRVVSVQLPSIADCEPFAQRHDMDTSLIVLAKGPTGQDGSRRVNITLLSRVALPESAVVILTDAEMPDVNCHTIREAVSGSGILSLIDPIPISRMERVAMGQVSDSDSQRFAPPPSEENSSAAATDEGGADDDAVIRLRCSVLLPQLSGVRTVEARLLATYHLNNGTRHAVTDETHEIALLGGGGLATSNDSSDNTKGVLSLLGSSSKSSLAGLAPRCIAKSVPFPIYFNNERDYAYLDRCQKITDYGPAAVGNIAVNPLRCTPGATVTVTWNIDESQLPGGVAALHPLDRVVFAECSRSDRLLARARSNESVEGIVGVHGLLQGSMQVVAPHADGNYDLVLLSFPSLKTIMRGSVALKVEAPHVELSVHRRARPVVVTNNGVDATAATTEPSLEVDIVVSKSLVRFGGDRLCMCEVKSGQVLWMHTLLSTDFPETAGTGVVRGTVRIDGNELLPLRGLVNVFYQSSTLCEASTLGLGSGGIIGDVVAMDLDAEEASLHAPGRPYVSRSLRLQALYGVHRPVEIIVPWQVPQWTSHGDGDEGNSSSPTAGALSTDASSGKIIAVRLSCGGLVAATSGGGENGTGQQSAPLDESAWASWLRDKILVLSPMKAGASAARTATNAAGVIDAYQFVREPWRHFNAVSPGHCIALSTIPAPKGSLRHAACVLPGLRQAGFYELTLWGKHPDGWGPYHRVAIARCVIECRESVAGFEGVPEGNLPFRGTPARCEALLIFNAPKLKLISEVSIRSTPQSTATLPTKSSSAAHAAIAQPQRPPSNAGVSAYAATGLFHPPATACIALDRIPGLSGGVVVASHCTTADVIVATVHVMEGYVVDPEKDCVVLLDDTWEAVLDSIPLKDSFSQRRRGHFDFCTVTLKPPPVAGCYYAVLRSAAHGGNAILVSPVISVRDVPKYTTLPVCADMLLPHVLKSQDSPFQATGVLRATSSSSGTAGELHAPGGVGPSSQHSRVPACRGLFIGCSYSGNSGTGASSVTLHAAANDAEVILQSFQRYALRRGARIPPGGLLLMTEFSAAESLKPTSLNIRSQLRTVIDATDEGDHLFIFFSGLGTCLLAPQVAAASASTTASFIPALLPSDFDWARRMILLEELANAAQEAALRSRRGRVMLIVDAGFTPTIADTARHLPPPQGGIGIDALAGATVLEERRRDLGMPLRSQAKAVLPPMRLGGLALAAQGGIAPKAIADCFQRLGTTGTDAASPPLFYVASDVSQPAWEGAHRNVTLSAFTNALSLQFDAPFVGEENSFNDVLSVAQFHEALCLRLASEMPCFSQQQPALFVDTETAAASLSKPLLPSPFA